MSLLLFQILVIPVFCHLWSIFFHTWSFLWENLSQNLWIRLKVNEEWLEPNKKEIESIVRIRNKESNIIFNNSYENYVYHLQNFREKNFYLYQKKFEVNFYPFLLHYVKTAEKMPPICIQIYKYGSSVNIEVSGTKTIDVVGKITLIFSHPRKDLMVSVH